MAKSQAVVAKQYSANSRAFQAKEQRRLEKANYSPMKKMEIVTKLRDTTREIKNARLIKKGEIVRG
jgi:hypothetical protein